MAAWEYRPSGITTAVTCVAKGFDGWPAGMEAAQEMAAQRIKISAQRT
jgi:hypothetical protein